MILRRITRTVVEMPSHNPVYLAIRTWDNHRMEDKYVCVAKVPDVSEARVVAARLASEGVETRIHGEPMGPFPMTIGRFAETELWVQAKDRPTAAIVLGDLGIECIPLP
jgi:hypothetical protein